MMYRSCAGILVILTGLVAVYSHANAPLGAQVTVSTGELSGIRSADGLKQFFHIPYAKAPVGELRWRPPQPAEPWTGVRDASKAGPACMQVPAQEGEFFGEALNQGMDEDCLHLNVWSLAESADEKLPVMVWIHGGALITGEGAAYPGVELTKKGVVLVTINYRLGLFGYLAHEELSAQHPKGVSGNQGVRDQIQALTWVRDNISAFGGDPDNVTIFGESAGSWSVSLLQASPLAKGLFHKAIGQSGGLFRPLWLRDQAQTFAPAAETFGAKVATAVAGEGRDASIAALRKVPAAQIIAAVQADPSLNNFEAMPIVDGEVIPQELEQIFANGEQADVPVLIGSNADESTVFRPYFEPLYGTGEQGFDRYLSVQLPEVRDQVATAYPTSTFADLGERWAALDTDVNFTYPMRVWARHMQTVKSPAYLYFFTWRPPIAQRDSYKAFHAAEIGYVFGDLTMFGAQPVAADFRFSNVMMNIWSTFARTGNPNVADLPHWPAFTAEGEDYMELGPTLSAGNKLRMPQMRLVEQAWAARRAAAQIVEVRD
jgi:para-nitrobenzyl esterase